MICTYNLAKVHLSGREKDGREKEDKDTPEACGLRTDLTYFNAEFPLNICAHSSLGFPLPDAGFDDTLHSLI